MQNITEQYQRVLSGIQSHPNYNHRVRIVAISKFQPTEKILQLFQAGQVIFGENRVQELREKNLLLPEKIDWHFVGALQSNKAKYIPSICSTMHSLCSLEVAKILEKKCEQISKKIKVLIQMNLCQEQQKSGLYNYEALQEFLSKILLLRFVEPIGLMTIPDPDLSSAQTGKIYSSLKKYQLQAAKEFSIEDSFKELSMGMSSDYKIAMSEGATMIRLGTILFGERS
jgi:pyridoxal phosphate enzyme (YggS family)